MAIFYQVIGRRQLGPEDQHGLELFEKSEAQDVDAALLTSELGWNLYTLDLKSRVAIFAKTAPDADMYHAPFLGPELFEHAVALLVIPFSQFIELSQNVPKPRTLVHLLNIGRCGSTLAHHLFNKVDHVLCLSEPETYFPLAMARHEMADSVAIELLKACSRFHFLAGKFRGDHALVIKHHSQSLFQATRIRRADPDAKCIFMYRDAESWANSLYRMAQGFGMPAIQPPQRKEFSWYMMSGGTSLTYLNGLVDLNDDLVQFESIAAVAWGLQLTEYMHLSDAGLKMLPVSYKELNTDRLRTVRRLFSYCDLATNHLETVLSAFDKDSQEGTDIGRGSKAIGFNSDNIRIFHEVLARCNNAPPADVVLPSLADT